MIFGFRSKVHACSLLALQTVYVSSGAAQQLDVTASSSGAATRVVEAPPSAPEPAPSAAIPSASVSPPAAPPAPSGGTDEEASPATSDENAPAATGRASSPGVTEEPPAGSLTTGSAVQANAPGATQTTASAPEVSSPAAPNAAFGQPWDDSTLAVDRYKEVPAAYVNRSLTQPEGTLGLSFANYSAFIATSQAVGWVPVLAFGITADVEVGVSAPLRYDEGLDEWVFLDPIPEVTLHLLDAANLEIGARAGVVLPATSESGAAVRLGVPLLWRAAEWLRVDSAAEFSWTFNNPRAAGVRIPVGATVQVAPWFFTGLGGAPSLGVGGNGKTALDAHALLGLTLAARERAQLDVTVRFFAENIGNGADDSFVDGAGTVVMFGFYPDVY